MSEEVKIRKIYKLTRRLNFEKKELKETDQRSS